MSNRDIRWIQRLSRFSEALAQMTKFIEKGELNELEEQGLIQAFEYTYELAWNTLKDYLEAQGETNLHGSRDVTRLAFKRGLLDNGETWMAMITSRTLTSHTYNKATADQIANDISTLYFPEFLTLRAKLETWKDEAE